MNMNIEKGGFYRDCNGNPCICMDNRFDTVEGVSLVDGVWRECIKATCGIKPLDIETAFSDAKRLRTIISDAKRLRAISGDV